MSIGSAKKWIPICHCYLQALAGVGRSLWRLLFSKQSRLNSHTLREYLFSLAAAFPGGAVVKKAKATSPSGAAGGKMDKLCVQRWKCTPGWAWVHVLLFSFPVVVSSLVWAPHVHIELCLSFYRELQWWAMENNKKEKSVHCWCTWIYPLNSPHTREWKLNEERHRDAFEIL